MNEQQVITDTQQWLERAVIGLNLCPFAKAAYVKQRVRFTVSQATTDEALLDDLILALQDLHAADATECETTLLIHPQALDDFLDYNDFLDAADAALDALGLTGVIQVASFHPQYQFAGTETDDIENFTNRAPYPLLHLLREDSIEQAVQSYPDVDHIPARNMATLNQLGHAGWAALGLTPASK
ncbi:MAG: DUF1415 domain-containing protein [Pseudomonadota bacterium]